MTKSAKKDPRTAAQIREHFEVERDLGDRLRNAPKDMRGALYATVYDELFRRVPHHPMLSRKVSPEQRRENLDWQLALLAGFLDKNVTYLEVGPGDCAVAFEAAKRVKKVYAVEVSETISGSPDVPENFQLILSDGSSIDVPDGSVDIVYSNQLMEHLHPDDALVQLKNVLRALAPGGVYLCITPNRLNGPHDISGQFGTEARGLHLREYTVTELSRLFRRAGFSRTMMCAGGRGKYWKCPVLPAILCESILQILPTTLRRTIASSALVRGFIGVRLVGIKGS